MAGPRNMGLIPQTMILADWPRIFPYSLNFTQAR